MLWFDRFACLQRLGYRPEEEQQVKITDLTNQPLDPFFRFFFPPSPLLLITVRREAYSRPLLNIDLSVIFKRAFHSLKVEITTFHSTISNPRIYFSHLMLY